MDKQYKDKLIRNIAREGMVLLKNDNNALPLKSGERVAAFGSTFYFCFKGGAGSGDVMGVFPVQPSEAIRKTEVAFDETVAKFYEKFNEERYFPTLHNFNRHWNCKFWYTYLEEPELPEGFVSAAAERNDVAIVNIARSEGENYDIKLEKGEFYLTDKEIALIEQVSASFQKVILLLNTYGVIDVEFMNKYNFDAILYTSMGGREMGNAVADVLTGKVSPSGKLASTWAPIDTYPTHEGFDGIYIPYNEGLYMGYRYYDSFGIHPTFPFGFGLSYTDFSIDFADCILNGTEVTVKANVKNIGKTAGKEVVQLYLSEPEGELNKAYQQLVAFQKTKELKEGEAVEVALSFDLRAFAAFRESTAEYILEKGVYTLRLGNSSGNTRICGRISLDDTAVTLKTLNRCPCICELDPIYPENMDNQSGEAFKNSVELTLSAADIKVETVNQIPPSEEIEYSEFCTLRDVREGKVTIEQFVATLSDVELVDLLNGVTGETVNIPNVGTMAKAVKGAAGETWSSEKYKIPPCVNADGPTGIRLTRHVGDMNDRAEDSEIALSMSAFPVATCVANTWNVELPRLMGEAVSDDMSISGVNGWLAPAMNIHRNPLCGRNFEYFSEDPLITGEMATAITVGTQTKPDGTPSGHYATIKHFAVNNAENHRLNSDSVVSERVLREIYLRGFEIAVKKGKPLALMNSYNKINGTYAADSYDLNTGILRAEWGFEGCVMTDWSTWNSAFLMSKAGCDLVMPGCKNKDYLEGLRDGRIKRANAQKCVANILNLILKTTK